MGGSVLSVVLSNFSIITFSYRFSKWKSILLVILYPNGVFEIRELKLHFMSNRSDEIPFVLIFKGSDAGS